MVLPIAPPRVSPDTRATLPLHVAVSRSLPPLPPAVPGGDLTGRQTPGGLEIRAREVRNREECHLPDVVGDTQECGGFSFVHEMQRGQGRAQTTGPQSEHEGPD